MAINRDQDLAADSGIQARDRTLKLGYWSAQTSEPTGRYNMVPPFGPGGEDSSGEDWLWVVCFHAVVKTPKSHF